MQPQHLGIARSLGEDRCCRDLGNAAIAAHHRARRRNALFIAAASAAVALVAVLVTAAINLSLQRDFAAEWSDSLRVKIFRPLGENAIKLMLRKNRR